LARAREIRRRMKHLTTTLLLTLLVLSGCSSNYEKCVEIETENIRIKDMENLGIAMESAQIRAENICFKEPSNFKNEEELLQAIVEEENCIDIHVQKFLPKLSLRTAESKAHDVCTMKILNGNMDLFVK
jgi:hypothetical protein